MLRGQGILVSVLEVRLQPEWGTDVADWEETNKTGYFQETKIKNLFHSTHLFRAKAKELDSAEFIKGVASSCPNRGQIKLKLERLSLESEEQY